MRRPISLAAALALTSCVLARSDDARLGIAREREDHDSWKIIECADFEFDGLADILWYSPTKNVTSIWKMRASQVVAKGPETDGPSGQVWRAVPIEEEAADFNFDGMADVLWVSGSTNLLTIWLMRGTEVTEKGRELEGPPDAAGWDLGAVGDFDGDGMSGVLWHNERESSALVWTLSGTKLAERGTPFSAPSGRGWTAINGLDFNGDFVADVLWYNASRNVMTVWLMAGMQVLKKGPEIAGPSGSGWVPVAASDLNGDSLADIVWSNPGRNVMEPWLMAGTQVLEKGQEIAGPSGGHFVIPTLADFNEDRLSDVVWLDPDTSRFAIWLMCGTQVLEAGPMLAGPGAAGG
jgi:hypothetical protein